jgi:putative Mg2+ transporter-C (MgtC) family protein
MGEEINIALQLLASAGLGGMVGYLREKEGKAAGLRTHMLVCLGSALLMVLSMFMAKSGGDPGRIASQVVTGIGFLGAGTIIRGEGGGVHGLTTAASVWVVAAIGLAVGAGYYIPALVTTLLAVVIIQGLHEIERYIRPDNGGKE